MQGVRDPLRASSSRFSRKAEAPVDCHGALASKLIVLVVTRYRRWRPRSARPRRNTCSLVECPFPLASWLTEVLDSAGEAIAFVPIAVALLTIAAAVWGGFRRTIGRRRDRYRRFARLGANAQLSFFTSVLGEPPAYKKKHFRNVRRVVARDEFEAAGGDWTLAPSEDYDSDDWDEEDEDDHAELGDGSDAQSERSEYVEAIVPTTYGEYFFIDRDYYVQAVCDEDDTVLAFSVTTRAKRFNPTFGGDESLQRRARRRFKKLTGRRWEPLFHAQLGRTRFSDLELGDWGVPEVRAVCGARTYSYSEAYYFGNPGHYQHFVFTASSAAHHGSIGPIWELGLKASENGWLDGFGMSAIVDGSALGSELGGLVQAVRRDTVITTYSVVGPHLGLKNLPTNFGPHGDEVRTLP